MHAYRHEWACQLAFNPRLTVSLGLSNREGTEHLWSHMIKLIEVKWSSSVRKWHILYYASQNTHRLQCHCRIWMIDCQAATVGDQMRSDLGDWIKCCLHCGIQEQGEAAQQQIDESGMDLMELWAQWTLQRASQLSVGAHMYNFMFLFLLWHLCL